MKRRASNRSFRPALPGSRRWRAAAAGLLGALLLPPVLLLSPSRLLFPFRPSPPILSQTVSLSSSMPSSATLPPQVVSTFFSPEVASSFHYQQVLGEPDVTDLLTGLPLTRLDPPLPVLFAASAEGLPAGSVTVTRSEARSLQVRLLEARAFWRRLLDASLPDGGVLWIDSTLWTALDPEVWYGFPGAAVRTRSDGRLALMATGTATDFSEAVMTAFRVAPLAHKGRLVAAGRGSLEGAAAYARAWTWVVVGEGLTEGLRIGTPAWWQRRLVGAAAAWFFLEAPRGQELDPGAAVDLEVWAEFLTGYLRPAAVPLTAAESAHPRTDPRATLELDARLLLLARRMVLEYGAGTFERLREAWPMDGTYEGVAAMLERLWTAMPALRGPGAVLLDPQGTGAGTPPPGATPPEAIPPAAFPLEVVPVETVRPGPSPPEAVRLDR